MPAPSTTSSSSASTVPRSSSASSSSLAHIAAARAPSPRLLLMLALLVLACAPRGAAGLYFYVTETPRCFIEEVPAETLVVGSYKNPDWVPYGTPNVEFTGVGVKISVSDPQGVNLLQRLAESSGKFAFTSQVGGEHVLCFSTNSSRWVAGGAAKLRLDLRLDVGEMGIDYSEVAKKEHLTELEVEVRRLNDKVKDIMKEQSYQREREVAFRNTSETTNSRVMWWSIFQMLVMAASSFFGVFTLQRFFHTKKMV